MITFEIPYLVKNRLLTLSCISYTYNVYGERTEMLTYRDGAANANTGDLTTWEYDPATGVLLSKTDAANRSVSYTYTSSGKIKTRTWERGVTTTYHYDDADRLSGITYSDNTPSVSIEYDRAGRQTRVTDASGSREIGYHPTTGAALGAVYELPEAGEDPGLLSGYAVVPTYADSGLRSGLTVKKGAVTLSSTGYTHDEATGRMATISHGGTTATYDWTTPVAGLPGRVSYTGSGITGVRTADTAGRLDAFTWYPQGTAAAAATPAFSHDYTYDARSRRTAAVREDGLNWSYGYNSLGEVTSASRGNDSFAYAFDGIGNRTSMTEGFLVATGNQTQTATTTYRPNALNQYTTIENPDPSLQRVSYRAHPQASISATSQGGAGTGIAAQTLQGTRASVSSPGFDAIATAAVTNGPAWRKITVSATRPGVGPGGAGLSAAREGWLYFPPKDEVLTYDEDGNQTTDARWEYFWDAENRLKGMQEKDLGLQARPADAPARQRLEFAYDSQSRRIRKVVKEWSAQQSNWVLKQDTRFLYDGWNLIAEFEMKPGTSNLKLTTTYAWGIDLSSNETGAGGVGGLLFVQLHSTTSTTANNGQSPQTPLAPAYDGNGNILAYLDCATGQPVARYEYDPFGRVLLKEESPKVAGKLHHQFSTKYCDAETGLSYYGFRYYSPEMGRWLNRDPLGEHGGLNLFGMVGNDAMNQWDYLGLADCGCPIPNNPKNVPRGITPPTVPDPRKDYSIKDENPAGTPTTGPGAMAGLYDTGAGLLAVRAAWEFFEDAKAKCGRQDLSKACLDCCVIGIESRVQELSGRIYFIGSSGYLVNMPCSKLKEELAKNPYTISPGDRTVDHYYLDW